MYPEFNFIRRFAQDVAQAARFVAFNIDLDLDLTEDELIEELEARGDCAYVGR